jgi:hypothetical protein
VGAAAALAASGGASATTLRPERGLDATTNSHDVTSGDLRHKQATARADFHMPQKHGACPCKAATRDYIAAQVAAARARISAMPLRAVVVAAISGG